MRAITIRQPYASLIAHGIELYESRTWSTDYRGTVAIHAARFNHFNPLPSAIRAIFLKLRKPFHKLPRACIIGTADIIDCKPCKQTTVPFFQHSLSGWSDDHWAWRLANPHLLDMPIPCKGALSLWDIPQAIKDLLYCQLNTGPREWMRGACGEPAAWTLLPANQRARWSSERCSSGANWATNSLLAKKHYRVHMFICQGAGGKKREKSSPAGTPHLALSTPFSHATL